MAGYGTTRGRGAIPLVELVAGDPRLLDPGETVFLALRGRAGAARLLRPPEEVFGRTEVKISAMDFLPTDFLGHACLHCGKPTAELTDFLVCVRSGAIVAVLHEQCFKRWFVLQDKSGFGGYRFGVLADARVACDDGVTRMVLAGETKGVEEIMFQRIEPLDYNQLADPGLDAEAAYVRRQGGGEPGESAPGAAQPSGTTDTNIIFCPHCDHPNNIPFLEMEGAHACSRCSGRFGVKVVKL